MVEIRTADGALLRCRRRAADGPPVILLHGLAANAEIWDLPELRTADFHFAPLGLFLQRSGFDVWMPSFRGHGAGPSASRPPASQSDWCVDDFLLLDLPAIVAHVCAARQSDPFVLGSSMGAMVLAGYLQGARLLADPHGPIVAEATLAAERHRRIRGAIFMQFPAALRWPTSYYDEAGRLRWQEFVRWNARDQAANLPFEMLARSRWLEALIGMVGEIPLAWLRGPLNWPDLPQPFGPLADRVEQVIASAAAEFVKRFSGGSNHRPEIWRQGRLSALESMKAGVLRQMAQGVRARAFVSLRGDPPHVYSDHYESIVAPLLVLAGGRDRIAHPDVTRSAFFERVRSADREMLVFPEMAHGEFEAAPIACERVYPRIAAWLARL